ncbi:MAG: TonB-dependent receptor [Cytophagia bacterium]|nr:TonB-dependent receptor [Cytophagia bacterium]
MLRKILFVALIQLGSIAAFAQTGTISGTITDSKTTEAIIGANVVIQGTSVGAATDIEGNFTIKNVKPGTYTLSVSFITYKTHTIPDVVVEAGKISTITIQLLEDATELQEVVVTGKREINNDISLMSAIKDSKLVVSGISAQQIVKLPDNDAAQVMKRVPGITIVDNRFVMVRGVPERYNQVLLNGGVAPSTEIDKRSFSFDLISSSAIDQLLIYKSGTAELPGDFAGGIIKVITKQTPSENYFNFGLNFGYRVGTTFESFSETERSKTDFLGFDTGLRTLPSSFPTTKEIKSASTISSIRESAARQLNNGFGYTNTTAPMDYGFSGGFGRNFTVGAVDVSTLANISYSTSYLNYAPNIIRYSSFDSDPETISEKQFEFKDNSFSRESKVSFVNNWLFKLSDNHQIEFKNLFVQIGENKTIFREGSDVGTQGGALNNNGSFQFVSRSIYSGQLQGLINSNNKSLKIDWVLGLNRIVRNEPDFRRYRSFYNDTEQAFRVEIPPSSNLFDASRFYSELKDIGYSNGVNVQKIFGDLNNKRSLSVKAGYLLDVKSRNFDARYFSYLFPSAFSGQLGEDLRFLPIDQIFSADNLYALNANGTVSREGFALEEGTDIGGKDSYKGKALTASGYVTATIPLGKFDLTGGFRMEYFNQELNTYNGDTVITNKVLSPLPFLNIAYNLTDRSLIRAAYGRTVNRPEFREIAPFAFYQFEYNLLIQGNTDLKTASIDNIDLRWEMYPNPGEMISFGTFYKSFTNPIEFVQQNNSGNLGFSYQNAPKAMSYGAELEVRKSLSSLGVSKILRNTSVNVNASLIRSEVDMGSAVTFQERFRPMQGQSPYVINSGIYYNDTDNGFSVNVAYNVLGNRIFSVGSVLFPSWIERPRNAVDLQIAKQFNKMELKLNIQNLLNAPYRFYQDNDENQKIDEKIDDSLQEYKTGSMISLSLGWKFTK